MESIYLVLTPADDDGDVELHAAFTTMEKARAFVKAEFDPKGKSQPDIDTVELDPTPHKRTFVTVWHTCIDIESGRAGNQGVSERCLKEDAKDEDMVVGTGYNLGYANAYSTKSAADSIARAKALCKKVKAEAKANIKAVAKVNKTLNP